MKTGSAADPGKVSDSSPPWGPLRHPAFRTIWLGWLAANMGMCMCDVSAAWLMTTLSTQPLTIALVQTTGMLPVLLLAVPSGAVADIVDRRRWLIATQLWLALTAGLLAVGCSTNLLSPVTLLALVFANGIGMALRWPVFSAVVPKVVPRPELGQALGLYGMAANASRVAAPLAAGVFLAMSGATFVFAMSSVLALASAAMIAWRWRYVEVPSALPKERLLSAVRVGLQYVRRSVPLRNAMVGTFALSAQVFTLLALLPVIAQRMPASGAGTYTLLFSSMGVGALAVAICLPRLHGLVSARRFVAIAMLVLGVCTAAVALANTLWVAAPAMALAGAAWLAAGNMLHVCAQIALPDWVRARGMSMYLVASMAGGAAGAALFGAIAEHAGAHDSLLILSALSIALPWVLRRWPIDNRRSDDLEPLQDVPRPQHAESIAADSGPVVITVEYEVAPRDAQMFAELMNDTGRSRLQSGALSWFLLRDIEDPRRFIETYIDPNWVEHLRRFERLTAGDARLRQQRLALHCGAEAPRISRYFTTSFPQPPKVHTNEH